MAKVRLTDAQVKAAALPTGKTEAVIWDTDVSGFGLRIRGASKSFVLAYRPAGAGRSANTKRLKIGTPGTLSVREARRLASAALGKVAAGGDPVQERRESKQRETRTVGDLLDQYEKSLERREYVRRVAVMSLLRRRLHALASHDITEVSGADFGTIIGRLDEAGERSAAATFRTRCSTFLNWCTFEARVLSANPLAGYRRPRDTRAERIAKTAHGRALSDHELAAVWHSAPPDTSFGRLIRFFILTGCRRSEGAKLTRLMIDRQRGRIDLPAAFTKQARGHTVFVSPVLAEVLDACEVDARNADLVFPSPRSGGVISGWSQLLDRQGKRTPSAKRGLVQTSGVDFTLHDLRRTFRTGLSRLGVDREIAELALGHAREDLEARYNRDDCEDALRHAFDAWGDHVRSVCAETVFD